MQFPFFEPDTEDVIAGAKREVGKDMLRNGALHGTVGWILLEPFQVSVKSAVNHRGVTTPTRRAFRRL